MTSGLINSMVISSMKTLMLTQLVGFCFVFPALTFPMEIRFSKWTK